VRLDALPLRPTTSSETLSEHGLISHAARAHRSITGGGETGGGETGGGGLPKTGPQTAAIAGGAGVLLATGLTMFLVARRRRIRFTA
jgi:LPXTG-motif cell wall-anchored protein